jgi:hypothetical protein
LSLLLVPPQAERASTLIAARPAARLRNLLPLFR